MQRGRERDWGVRPQHWGVDRQIKAAMPAAQAGEVLGGVLWGPRRLLGTPLLVAGLCAATPIAPWCPLNAGASPRRPPPASQAAVHAHWGAPALNNFIVPEKRRR